MLGAFFLVLMVLGGLSALLLVNQHDLEKSKKICVDSYLPADLRR
jgi:hypothetical protein